MLFINRGELLSVIWLMPLMVAKRLGVIGYVRFRPEDESAGMGWQLKAVCLYTRGGTTVLVELYDKHCGRCLLLQDRRCLWAAMVNDYG